VVATWLAADCSGLSCMTTAGWCGTSSRMMVLAMRLLVGFLPGCGCVAWCTEGSRVELCSRVDITIQSVVELCRVELCSRVDVLFQLAGGVALCCSLSCPI